MKLNHLITICTVILIKLSTYGQITEAEVREMASGNDEPVLVMQASTLTQEGYLYYAEIIVDRLLTMNPQSSNYHYRKGYLMLEIRRDYEGAIPHFQMATIKTDHNYDMYSAKELSAPPDAFFHLATCYHLNEEMDKAIEFYTKFIDISKKKSELIPVSKLRLIQCDEAKLQMAAPVNVFLRNIGPVINTEFPDYSTVVSLDGLSLYFTSRRPWENGETEAFRDPKINQYPEDVYVSYQESDSVWTKPIRLEFCEPKRNEASVALSTDERRIYLYEDSTGSGDIYYTDFYHAKFQDINFLDAKGVNTKYWETHGMMTHDNSRFFFASDRPNGFGGLDIYYMDRLTDSTWSKAFNLGPKINSPYDEDSPFIAINNKTLYYSTNGEKSIGFFDIMKTELIGDTVWSEGQNLGYPFNSTNDDIYYTTTIDGKKGYMTSFRKDGHGEKDIYEIYNDYLGVRDIAVLKGLIKTVDNKPIPEDFAINVRMVCIDCDEAGNLVYPRLRDGVFMTGLLPCKTYRLEYMDVTENVILHEDGFTTICDTAYQEIYRELLLDVDRGVFIFSEDTITLDTIIVKEYLNLEFIHYFDYNKNKLSTNRGDLKTFVKEIEAQLKDGREQITINIYSSASHVPTKTYETNENLTKIRAENMKYDLISHFEKKEEYKGKVNVVIVTQVVQGPEYEKDARNKEKYHPYQYVGLKTE